MKVLFIHLSDFHIKEEDAVLSRVKARKICQSLGSFDDVSKAIILFTGDISYSGKEAEYTNAAKSLNRLREAIELTGTPVSFFFVPGNHDVSNLRQYPYEKAKFRSDWRDYFDLQNLELENYRSFASSFGSPSLDSGLTQFYEESIVEGGEEEKITICLVNTAPLSFVGVQDKGLHHIDEDSIALIREMPKNNLNIMLMHHSPEWFDESCRRSLANAMCESMNIAFIGHEHCNESFWVDEFGKSGLTIMKADESSLGPAGEFFFSAISFDFSTRRLRRSNFSWDGDGQLFNRIDKGTVMIRSVPRKALIPLNQSFVDLLERDNSSFGGFNNVSEYFVFPSLVGSVSADPRKRIRIDSEDDFFNRIEGADIIDISGSTGSGKSTLLRVLCRESVERGYAPLLAAGGLLSRNLDEKIEKLVKDQYGRDFVDAYWSAPKDKKILFVDEVLKVDRALLLQYVGKVVVTSSEFFDPSEFGTDLLEAAELGFSGVKQISVSIEPTYQSRRTALVKSVCLSRGLSDFESQCVVDAVNTVAQEHRSMLDLKPWFILAYAEYYIRNKAYVNASDTLPLTEIYRDNVRDCLSKAYRRVMGCRIDDGTLEQHMMVLELISESMHSRKEPMIAMGDAVAVIEEANKEKLLKLNPGQVLDVFEKSELMFKDPKTAKYRLRDVNTLAFFVAESIEARHSDDGDIREALKELVDGICLGVNERVVQFLTSSKNSAIWVSVLSEKLDEFGTRSLFDLDAPSILYLKGQNASEIPLFGGGAGETTDLLDSVERSLPEGDALDYQDAYRRGSDDSGAQDDELLCTLKCLEILSRSFSLRFARSRSNEKEQERRIIFEYSRMIIQSALSIIDENFSERVSSIRESLLAAEGVDDVPSESDIAKFMVDFSYLFVSSLFDHMGYCCSSVQTFNFLGEYSVDDICTRAQKMYVASYGMRSEEFVEYFCQAVKNLTRGHSPQRERSMYKLCANLYLLRNPYLDRRLVQRIGAALGDRDAERKAILARGEARH